MSKIVFRTIKSGKILKETKVNIGDIIAVKYIDASNSIFNYHKIIEVIGEQVYTASYNMKLHKWVPDDIPYYCTYERKKYIVEFESFVVEKVPKLKQLLLFG